MIRTLAPISDELDEVEDLLDRLADDVPGRPPAMLLELLEMVDGALAGVRTRVADARAIVIAEAVHAEGSSSRKAAEELGLSLAAVSKAVARARDLPAPDPEPAPA